MSLHAMELRRDVERLQEELERRKRELAHVERQCQHDFEVAYTPQHQEGYLSPGDPPGTMGIDRQLPCHVPAKTTRRWTRTCKKCGTQQTTTRTRTSKSSVSGCSTQQETPDFGD